MSGAAWATMAHPLVSNDVNAVVWVLYTAAQFLCLVDNPSINSVELLFAEPAVEPAAYCVSVNASCQPRFFCRHRLKPGPHP